VPAPACLPVLRVRHRLPGRIRLRIEGIEWTPQLAERLVGRVARMQGVTASRFSIHCASLTLVHVSAQETVLAEVRQILRQLKVAAHEVPVQLPAAMPHPARRQARAASRRLVACAVIGLVLALMPDPVTPAMILLRLVVGVVSAAVERQALTVTEMPPVARLLGRLALLVSVARADQLARTLAEAVLGQLWSSPRTRTAGTIDMPECWGPGAGSVAAPA